MKNRLSTLVASLALAAGASSAFAADSISIAWQGNASQAGVALKAYDLTLSADEAVFDDLALQLKYTNLTANSSFLAFCIEPLAGNSTLPATYSVSSFSGAQATHLAALYQTSYSSSMSATQQAAFQLAVWEFTQETAVNGTTAYGTQTGSFRSEGSTQVTSLADTYVASALSFSGTSSYKLVKLSNADYQDLIMAAAVPEPESYLLFLAGLGAIGMIARRRLPR